MNKSFYARTTDNHIKNVRSDLSKGAWKMESNSTSAFCVTSSKRILTQRIEPVESEFPRWNTRRRSTGKISKNHNAGWVQLEQWTSKAASASPLSTRTRAVDLVCNSNCIALRVSGQDLVLLRRMLTEWCFNRQTFLPWLPWWIHSLIRWCSWLGFLTLEWCISH